jgi:hypothetical protein
LHRIFNLYLYIIYVVYIWLAYIHI